MLSNPGAGHAKAFLLWLQTETAAEQAIMSLILAYLQHQSQLTSTWVQEMERKRRMGMDGAAAGREHFRLQREAQQAKEQAAFEAAQNSRRILGDERAKDQAWRDAVLKAGICGCLIRKSPALLH